MAQPVRHPVVSLFSAAAMLLTGCEAGFDVTINDKEATRGIFSSTVYRIQDKVSVDLTSFTHVSSITVRKYENFKYECSDRNGIEAVYNQAVAESAEWVTRIDTYLKSLPPENSQNPQTLNKMKNTLDRLHYTRGKADAFAQAIKICETSPQKINQL